MPRASSKGVRAKPVATVPAPVPRKKITIMPDALQRSPSQPAGRAPAPNKIAPASAKGSSCS
jgi:hypothetical protein